MRLGFYLYFVILLGVAFDLIEKHEAKWFPPDGILTFFPLRPWSMHFSSWIYYIQETIVYISIAVVPYFFKRNHFLTAFIVLEGLDLVDFCLTGNRTWFNYGEIPITFNIVKALSFGLLLSYEFSRRNITSLHT